MKKLLPLLQSLAENHPDTEVQEMASDLRVAIATHGVVWSERLSKSDLKKPVSVNFETFCIFNILSARFNFYTVNNWRIIF